MNELTGVSLREESPDKEFFLVRMRENTDTFRAVSALLSFSHYPVNIYLFKINYRNTRKRFEICLKLTKTPERRQ